MKKNILFILTSIIVIVLFSMQLIVSNRLATMGAELSAMQKETTGLQQENEKLQHTIASRSSLMTISKEAEQLGFSRATVRYLERPPVAFNR